jgi:polyphosphate kinase
MPLGELELARPPRYLVTRMQPQENLVTDPSLLSVPGIPLIHRDLSWLQFNDRVLFEALDKNNPLLERLKFLAITQSNLDEFFMIRLASMTRATQDERHTRILSSILKKVHRFGLRQAEAFYELQHGLRKHDIVLVYQPEVHSPMFKMGKRIFDSLVLPKLETPKDFSSQNLSQLENLQMVFVYEDHVWFRIPKTLAPALWVRDEETSQIFIFFLDDLLRSHLGSVFGFKGEPSILRLTRDADFTVEIGDETTSIPDVIRSGISGREKGRAVRLQYQHLSPKLRSQCTAALKLREDQVVPTPTTFCLYGLWTVFHQLPDGLSKKKKLNYPAQQPSIYQPFRKPESVFEVLKRQDILLHHPYDAFDCYTSWIESACKDPNVIQIEQTVYRIDAVSSLIESLKQAAKEKKIRVVIELRARFDESNNLRLADELRQAGAEVAFGFGKLKLHAKVALVTRKEGQDIRRYTHLSTGNYNAATARKYVDLAVITSNPEIGEDARHFFDAVCKREIPSSFKRLVPAPTRLHKLVQQQIEAETKAAMAGKSARIFAKVNALVDDSIIESLYRASQAGVQVDLLVRGACSLVPGVRGLSENIRVLSIVDRYLEHSRIYYFQSAQAMYLSSADWMPRNFFSRLELAFPVLDPHLFQYIEETIIPTYLQDNVKARELTPKGTWRDMKATLLRHKHRAQFKFEEYAVNGYENTALR